MERLFYSTGQVAHQLGITLAAVRVLCENGVIAAETTPGGHWRVPASEVERVKREGVPPIPRPLPVENTSVQKNGVGSHAHLEVLAEPADQVLSAADQVAIARSVLEKRKIDREIEEAEDWFRDRQRQQAAEEAAERQTIEAKERRMEWTNQWMQYAINSVPSNARREVEMEIHSRVAATLAALESDQPAAITQRLVDAVVHRALGPWRRKRDTERAIEAGMSRLAWDVRHGSEYVSLKQRARDAAVAAVRMAQEEASFHEMEIAATQAVEPMIREYEHQQACHRIVGRVHMVDALREEQEAAKESVRKALTSLPIDAGPKELEMAAEAALTPHKAEVAHRKEADRLESDRQTRRRAAGWKVDFQLAHIASYLEQEYEFEGGYSEIRREADRLRPLIREALINELLQDSSMGDADIRTSIEAYINDELTD